MKIYVDGELPKECFDCPCHNGENGNCKILNKYTEYMPKDCPLHSLSDHDQQIRADERSRTTIEVCERLNAIIEKYLCKKGRYRESIDISSIIKQVEKGENNERN